VSRSATPPLLTRALSDQPLPAFLARVGAWLAGLRNRPFKVGNRLVVARHVDVAAVLSRDLQFLIGPVNAKRIEAVNGGPFVLGMDRCATLVSERAALYRALGRFDLGSLHRQIQADADMRIGQAGTEIDVVGAFARPIAAETASTLFGVRPADRMLFMDSVRAVFAHTFLNLNDDAAIRERAEKAGALMQKWLADEITARRGSGEHGTDMMGALLSDSTMDDEGVRRILGGMLVGSIDTTASSVARIVVMLGRDRDLAARVAADVDDPQRLAGWCREILRLWPHNPILLREVAGPGKLAGVPVAAGDKVVLWTQAAMLDPAVFPQPRRLDPTRPVDGYLHFGGGLHPCAGRAVNAIQIPTLVGALVRRGIASVGKISWAGPFPDRLLLTFDRQP